MKQLRIVRLTPDDQTEQGRATDKVFELIAGGNPSEAVTLLDHCIENEPAEHKALVNTWLALREIARLDVKTSETLSTIEGIIAQESIKGIASRIGRMVTQMNQAQSKLRKSFRV
jgi:hypothetical protein